MLETLKWLATATLIIGSYVNATGHPTGPFILILGGALWLGASMVMKDKQLIVTNSVMMMAGALGLYQQYLV